MTVEPQAIFDEEERTALQEGLENAHPSWKQSRAAKMILTGKISPSTLEGLKDILRRARHNLQAEKALALVQFALQYLGEFRESDIAPSRFGSGSHG